MIRVFLCNTDSSSDTLEAALRESPAIDLVGKSRDAYPEAMAIARMRSILDVFVLRCAAVDVGEAQLLAALHPLPALVTCGRHSEQSVALAMRSRARGVMIGVSPTGAELVGAIKLVASGYSVFCENSARKVIWSQTCRDLAYSAFPDLTDREREVLNLVAIGLDNQQIARKLSIVEKTVRNHVTNIYTKLNVPNRAGAIVKAHVAGLGV